METIKIPKEEYEKMTLQIKMLKKIQEMLNREPEKEIWNKLAINNPSFNFLKDEPETYREEDIIEK